MRPSVNGPIFAAKSLDLLRPLTLSLSPAGRGDKFVDPSTLSSLLPTGEKDRMRGRHK